MDEKKMEKDISEIRSRFDAGYKPGTGKRYTLKGGGKVRRKGGNKTESHGNVKLPYGIAKGEGIDTTGMAPSDVWEVLKGRGYSPKTEYAKLSNGPAESKEDIENKKAKFKSDLDVLKNAVSRYKNQKEFDREFEKAKYESSHGEKDPNAEYNSIRYTMRKARDRSFEMQQAIDVMKRYGGDLETAFERCKTDNERLKSGQPPKWNKTLNVRKPVNFKRKASTFTSKPISKITAKDANEIVAEIENKHKYESRISNRASAAYLREKGKMEQEAGLGWNSALWKPEQRKIAEKIEKEARRKSGVDLASQKYDRDTKKLKAKIEKVINSTKDPAVKSILSEISQENRPDIWRI